MKRKKEGELKIRASYEPTRFSNDYLSEVYKVIFPLLTRNIPKKEKNNISIKNEIIKKKGAIK